MVYDPQAYRNMEMTREHISFTFDPRNMLLSLQIGFSFVRAAVACAILKRISSLKPSSETTALGYLKLLALRMPLSALCHQFGLLSTDLHLIP